MNEKNNKVSWIDIFGVASVCFGIHVGGGFATGNQTVNFFVSYGWTTVFFPIIAMVLLNLVFRECLRTALIHNTPNYRAWSNAAFRPAEKIMSNIYEVCYLMLVTLGVSSSIAGGAALLETYGLIYVGGVVLVGIIFFILTIFGKELLQKASTVMTICIVISLFIICYFGLKGRGAAISTIVSTRFNNDRPMGSAIWKMFQYVGYQAFNAASVVPYAATLKNKKSINKAMTINFVINALMLTLTTLMLLAHVPDVYGETLPILSICKGVGLPAIEILYAFILFMAFISTGIGCLFGIITRFETKVLQNMKLIKRRSAICLVVMVISMSISMFGLSAIVSKGYAYVGVIGVFLMVIPCLTFIAIRNSKEIDHDVPLDTDLTN